MVRALCFSCSFSCGKCGRRELIASPKLASVSSSSIIISSNYFIQTYSLSIIDIPQLAVFSVPFRMEKPSPWAILLHVIEHIERGNSPQLQEGTPPDPNPINSDSLDGKYWEQIPQELRAEILRLAGPFSHLHSIKNSTRSSNDEDNIHDQFWSALYQQMLPPLEKPVFPDINVSKDAHVGRCFYLSIYLSFFICLFLNSFLHSFLSLLTIINIIKAQIWQQIRNALNGVVSYYIWFNYFMFYPFGYFF